MKIAQLVSAGSMELTVKMTDPEAKSIMVATPNVTMTVNGKSYPVYEVNPTVVPDSYLVRLTKGLANSALKDTTVTFVEG